MSEEESCEEYVVRYVSIKTGVSEDGGGIEITVRDDSADIEKLAELALKLYEGITNPPPPKTKNGENSIYR